MKKAYNFLIAIYPILSAYGFSPQADFGVLALFVIGLICVFLYGRMKPRLPDGYALFFIFALLFSLIFARSIPLRLLLYTVNLLMACNYVDFKLLKKYYFLIANVCIVYLFIQEFANLVFGVRLFGLVSFIPTIYASRDDVDFLDIAMGEGRSASFFLEPSYFVQFLFPYIILLIFNDVKPDYFKAGVASVAILLTRSGHGLALLLIIWGTWLILSSIKPRTKIAVSLLGCSILAVLFVIGGEAVDTMLARTSEFQSISGEEQTMTSGFVRFFRGYYVYADMPLFNRLFGSNPDYIKTIATNTGFFGFSGNVDFNGMQTLLLYYGLFVTILFLRHLVMLFKGKRNTALVVMVICFIWLMLGESYFLCSRMFLTTILMYAMTISSKDVRKMKQALARVY